MIKPEGSDQWAQLSGQNNAPTKLANPTSMPQYLPVLDRPLNGPFSRGRFPPWRDARRLPISLKEAFPILNGPFSDLNGPSPRMPKRAVFPLENPLENCPLRKGALSQDTFDHDKGQNLQFWGAVSWTFWSFLRWIFPFFSRFTVQFSKEMAPKCGENCPLSGRREKCRILSRLWLSWFFRPRLRGS